MSPHPKSKLLLVFCAGAFAAAGALLLWGAGREPAPLPPLGAGVEAAASRDAEGPAAGAVATLDADEFGGAVVDAPLRTSAASAGPAASRLTLQVWDGEEGKPAAGAEVFVLDGREAFRRGGFRGRDRDGFGPDPFEVVEDEGRRFRAADDGTVVLMGLEGRALVAARLPGRFAAGMLRGGDDRETLVLGPDETVTVRVVDANGRPVAGAPVAIQQRLPRRVDVDGIKRELQRTEQRLAQVRAAGQARPNGPDVSRVRATEARLVELQQRVMQVTKLAETQQAARAAAARARGQAAPKAGPVLETRWDVRARRRTGDDGVAVFRHFQRRREEPDRWWPRAHHDRFQAALIMPLAEPPRASFRGRPLHETVELRMPPVGSIVLRTVDRDGRPFTHPVRGELRVVGGANPGWTRLTLRKEQDEAEIVFPFVGLGLQLEARCRLDDDDFRWTSPALAGPQRPGERVEVDLVVAPDAGMLYGRVLAADGEPMASEEVTFLINSALGRLEGEEVELDADGRFHLPYRIPGDHRPPFRLQVRHEEREPVPGHARAVPALPLAQVVDIGDLQLEAFDCVAFGQVVDDRGEPVAGARVQLQRERVTGRGDELRFRDEAFTDTRSGDDGTFALFGDVLHGRYRLHVSARDHLPFESVGLPGADGIVVRLVREARLVGRVRLPEGLDRRDVEVEYVARAEPGRARGIGLRGGGPEFLMRSGDLRPGLYDVTFRVEQFPDPVARVEAIELQPGQTDTHPRLANVDLSGALFRYEVKAVDAAGKSMTPRAPLLARIRRPDGAESWVGFAWRRGTCEIISAEPTLEVRALASGHRSDATWLNPGQSELRFTPVPPLRLRVPGMRAAAGDETVTLMVRPVQTTELEGWNRDSRRVQRAYRGARTSFGRVGADDVADLRPLRDGRYGATAFLGERSSGLVSMQLGEFDVRLTPGAGAVTHTLAVDAARVAQALRELAARRAAPQQGRGR